MNKLFIFMILLCLVVFSGIPHHSYAKTKKIRIIYFNSDTPDNHWWKTSSDIMQAACRDLGMDLKVVYVNRNAFQMVDDFRKAAGGPEKPDAVVFQNLKTNAVKMLEIAEAAGVRAFIFNSGLSDEQTARYGGPRQSFKYWIGQMLPDDKKAGYNLAMQLYREAVRLNLKDSDGKVNFIGLTGTDTDVSAIERFKGLAQAAKEQPGIVINQSASGYWERDRAKAIYLGLTARYPMTRVVWAANDPMGLGALDGMSERKQRPGRDMLVGSIDWIPEALEKVQKGQLVTSIGGHFMETGWVAVLLYDYFHGYDFAAESVSYKSEMKNFSRTTISNYLKYFHAANFHLINFSRFSKAKNPGLKRYYFNFDSALNNMVGRGVKK